MAEAAVMEPPAQGKAEPIGVNIGDVYEKTLAKEHEKENAPPVAPSVVTSEKVAETKPAEEKKAVADAPKSALEAALSEAPADDTAKADADPLKDLPETLPNENRKDHWAKARAAIKTLSEERGLSQKEITALRTQIEKVKENPESKAELERYKSENATLRDAITAANIELLPEFRAKYIDGSKQLVAKAQEKVKAYGGDAEALVVALHLPEGTRREAAIAEAMGENISDLGKSKINGIIAQIDSLNEEAEQERANSQQAYERLTEKQKVERQQQAEQIELRKKSTFEDVTRRLQTEVPTLRPVKSDVEGAEQWNNELQADVQSAQKLFGPDASPEDTVSTAIKGVRYDRVAGMLADAFKENSQLKKQLAEMDGSQPDIKGGRATPKSNREAQIEKSPELIYAETMAALSNRED